MIGCANHNAISNPNLQWSICIDDKCFANEEMPEKYDGKKIQKIDYHLDEFCSGQSHNHLKWIKKRQTREKITHLDRDKKNGF